jgi:eukaryotic-like serine/threonine-protein kinase
MLGHPSRHAEPMPPPKADKKPQAPALHRVADEETSGETRVMPQRAELPLASKVGPRAAPHPGHHAKIADEESSGGATEVFVAKRDVPSLPSLARGVPAESSTRLYQPAKAKEPPGAKPVDNATVREARASVVAPPEARVSLLSAPLGEQGFDERYRTLGVLGEGGMGIVSLRKDTRIGREVAIKLLHKKASASADARMRFEREARVQGQLEHPAVVPVYDLGVAPDGTPFFTMKRLRGENLADILDALQKGRPTAAPYSRRKLLTAFSSVCLAIDFANARGVLHRDLKPGNVMLGSYGEVYVLDWGLAKLTGAEGQADDPISMARAQKETQVGEVMGTPGYMSPEQLRGEVDQLDGRTDVYSLGVVLFELLTLEPLHDRKGLDTIYNSTLGKLPARLSERAFARGVPPELVGICVRATALDRGERYASARALHDAIERFLDGERDAKERGEMAEARAKTAREAADLADKMPEMRELALREVSAALALDPSHGGAVETLMRLLVDAPGQMTAEMRAEFERERRPAERVSMRGSFLGYLIWIAFAPVVFALGVKSPIAAALNGGLVILATLLSWLGGAGRLGGSARFAAYCLGTLAVGTTCTLMGWAIVLPGIAAVHTLGYLLHGEKRLVAPAIVLGVLTVLVPFALQSLGVLPAPYAFEGGRMVVLPLMTALPPEGTKVYLLLASVAVIVAPTIVITRMRDALARAEERAFLHAWNLQRLLPGRTRDAAAMLRPKGGRRPPQ